MTDEGDARQLHALTGLRFLAAAYVVLYHLWRFETWDGPTVLEDMLRGGPSAVSLFFVLSGFVLSHRYTDHEGAVRSLRGYARARMARLAPVHVLAWVLSVPVAMALWRRAGPAAPPLAEHMAHGALSLLGLQAFVPSAALAFNPPAWSLSVELFCYAWFPLALPVVSRLSARRALGAFVAVWLGALGLALALAHVADAAPSLGAQRSWVHVFKFHPLVRAPEFLLGALTARLYVRRWHVDRGVLLLGVSAALLVPAALSVVPYALWHNAWLSPAWAALIVLLADSEGRGVLARLLAARPLRVLGEASYALYLLHVPLLYWIAGIGQRRTGTKVLEHPAVAAWAFVGCIACAWLVWRAVEVPLRARLRGGPVPAQANAREVVVGGDGWGRAPSTDPPRGPAG